MLKSTTTSRSMPNDRRKQPIFVSTKSLPPTISSPRERPNVGEFAGGAAAECAAIWCCCPCLVMDVLVITMVKVPTGLVRRMRKKYRQKRIMRRKTKGLLPQQTATNAVASCEDEPSEIDFKEFEMIKVSIDGSAEVVELDKEMWDQFYNTGFWRSPSQKDL